MAEGYDVIGFDIEKHEYGDHSYPAQLVLQDVRTIHGRQFKDAALIVASPPCQAYSYRAMPWKRAKALPPPSNELFEACFRIQREAIEAAGHFIPLVVENVKGAQPWVGRSRWNFGSLHLWGDVPALMPIASAIKNAGGSWFRVSHNKVAHTRGDRYGHTPHMTNPAEHIKVGKDGFFENGNAWMIARGGPGSAKRKYASAMIAKIPLTLSSHIARVYRPTPSTSTGEP